MRGNLHVRFLGEGVAVTPPPYPTLAGVPKNIGCCEVTSMSILRFSRPYQFSQGPQSWRLYVDGQFVANIGNGSSVEVRVAPGAHEVLARTMILYSSGVLPVEVRDGKTLDVEVGSNWRVLGKMYLFARSDYLYLRLKSPQLDRAHPQAWGRGLLVGGLMAGLLAVVCLGGCGLLFSWFFSTTNDAARAADQFLMLLGEGKVTDAYNSTATGLRAQESQEAFADSVRQIGLADYASSSWQSREFHNDVVTLKGSITTKPGGTVPLTVVLIKEAGSWRVLSVTAPDRKVK